MFSFEHSNANLKLNIFRISLDLNRVPWMCTATTNTDRHLMAIKTLPFLFFAGISCTFGSAIFCSLAPSSLCIFDSKITYKLEHEQQ